MCRAGRPHAARIAACAFLLIKSLRHRVDCYEAYLAWVLRRHEHDEGTAPQ